MQLAAGTPSTITKNPTPGIVLATGDLSSRFSSGDAFESVLTAYYGQRIKPAGQAIVGNWLSACVLTRLDPAESVFRGFNGMTVLFDGYISDCISKGNYRKYPYATLIGHLYREQGERFVGSLRGSFVGLIIDRQTDSAFLFNDRQGSRPLFLRPFNDRQVLIAPQVKFLASLEPELNRLNKIAVGQFLIRGCFYSNDTLYEGIEKIPQASMLSFANGNWTLGQYWTLHFKSISNVRPDEDALIDEFDSLLCRATERLLKVAKNPILLLSGGIDSRLLLAYLLIQGVKHIPTFTYAVSGTNGDDHLVAKRTAEHSGLSHETHVIEVGDLPAWAKNEVLAVDGRVQVVDAPSNRWEYLGSKFAAFFNGDKFFGWGKSVVSVNQALDTLGWWNVDKVPRIADWIIPDELKQIRSGIAETQRSIVAHANEPDPNDLKDKIYYEERNGNMINGYSARRLWFMEQLRPLLDEDVTEFITRLPARLRQDKYLARRLMESKHASLHALGYSKRAAVPWGPRQFTKIVSHNDDLFNYIVGNLVENLDPRLSQILDSKRLRKTIVPLFKDQALPPLRKEWWTFLPGMWRFSRERYDRVGAVRGALRLLGLNLYLKE